MTEDRALDVARLARGPGRPRSEATRRAILDAALDLLHKEPYRQISIDKIAVTARVGKQSIYRWWGSKAEVLLDAYAERAVQLNPVPSPTGDAFQDIENGLKHLFELARDPQVGGSVCTLIAEAQFDREFQERLYSQFIARRRSYFKALLDRGIDAGQIRSDCDWDAVLDLILGAFWFRLLSGAQRPIDDGYAAFIVDTIRPAIAAEAHRGVRRRQPQGLFEA